MDAQPERVGIALWTVDRLVSILNQGGVLLRTGRLREAGEVTAGKTRLAQDYMGFARSVQRERPRLRVEAPAMVEAMKVRHEQFATQMAENLRVIATARAVTEDLLTDVASAMSAQQRPKTYGASGTMSGQPPVPATGVSINRAL